MFLEILNVSLTQRRQNQQNKQTNYFHFTISEASGSKNTYSTLWTEIRISGHWVYRVVGLDVLFFLGLKLGRWIFRIFWGFALPRIPCFCPLFSAPICPPKSEITIHHVPTNTDRGVTYSYDEILVSGRNRIRSIVLYVWIQQSWGFSWLDA